MDNLGEARRAMGSLDRTFREVLDGFAEGYSRYVRQHRHVLPAWVPEATAVDVLAYTRASAATAAASPALVRALLRKYPETPGAAGPPPAPGDLRVRRSHTFVPFTERPAAAPRPSAPR